MKKKSTKPNEAWNGHGDRPYDKQKVKSALVISLACLIVPVITGLFFTSMSIGVMWAIFFVAVFLFIVAVFQLIITVAWLGKWLATISCIVSLIAITLNGMCCSILLVSIMVASADFSLN